jgi:hypothetical protein
MLCVSGGRNHSAQPAGGAAGLTRWPAGNGVPSSRVRYDGRMSSALAIGRSPIKHIGEIPC